MTSRRAEPDLQRIFAALADPTRRRILELLATGEATAGDLSSQAQAETGLSQPGISQHLRSLRAADLVTVRSAGTRRIYRIHPAALAAVGTWLQLFDTSFQQPLDALATELARGRRQRRRSATGPPEAQSL